MKLTLQITTQDGTIDAVTENISANGILFSADKLPTIDTRIEFTIKMPAAVMGTPEDLLIQCIGRVIRHGDEGQAAAIIDEYSLRT